MKKLSITLLIFFVIIFANCQNGCPVDTCSERLSSAYLIEVPNLSSSQILALFDNGKAKIVIPNGEQHSVPNTAIFIDTISNWSGFFEGNIDYYFLLEGDYASFGRLSFDNISTGNENNRKFIIGTTISKEGEIEMIENKYCKDYKEVKVGFFEFKNSSYWTINGVTFKRDLTTPDSIGTGLFFRICSNHNIINNCLFEDQKSECIRIINSGFNTIQNSVFRNMTVTEEFLCSRNDVNIGVAISAYSPSDTLYFEDTSHNNVGIPCPVGSINTLCFCDEIGESRGNVICNNYFYDLVDGFQLNYDNDKTSGYCPETKFDNNVVYIDKMNFWDASLGINGAFYSAAENGIDIKVGSIIESDSVIISNNTLWGFRPPNTSPNLDTCSAESDGAAITIHGNAQNIIIKNNHIHDSSVGIYFHGSIATISEEGTIMFDSGLLKNITVKDNTFSEIRNHPAGENALNWAINFGHPIVFHSYIDSLTVENNNIYDSDKYFLKKSDDYNYTDGAIQFFIKNNHFFNQEEIGDIDNCPVELANGNSSCFDFGDTPPCNEPNCSLNIKKIGNLAKGCGRICCKTDCSN